MAYIVPSMPLAVNYWRNESFRPVWPVLPVPDYADLPAQLRPGYKPAMTTQVTALSGLPRELVLPKTTEISLPTSDDSKWWTCCDLVEIESGSGRWYIVIDGERVAKGFVNEYIVATVIPTREFEGTTFNTLPGYTWFPTWTGLV